MSTHGPVYCVVDDTPLTGNLEEIEPWIQTGAVALVVPLYTLERLHLLKKDASQIGHSARKAVKFLDQITSTPDLLHDPVIIQGPDDMYSSWPEVEARYAKSIHARDGHSSTITDAPSSPYDDSLKDKVTTTGDLMQELSPDVQDGKSSPLSTPPLSPSTSEVPSTRTSPEVRCATVTRHDATPIPPVLKPLVNFVVWYKYENTQVKTDEVIFLTNSADAAQIAKDFAINVKTIHQLRASIITSINPEINPDPRKTKKKGSNRKSSVQDGSKVKTLFSYDEVSSDEEELVFQPRARDLPRPASSGRGASYNVRGRGSSHSPSNSISTPSAEKPQVPVEEIDPDSFDRGTFARGSIPLANVGNHYGPQPVNNTGRGQRGFGPTGSRGGFRGSGFRGRGRGRLFVP